MPAANPRVSVVLSPSVHAALVELSRLTGNSISGLVGDLLLESLPVLERMTTVLGAAELLKAQGAEQRDEILRGLERSQTRIEAQLGLALDDMTEGTRPLLAAADKIGRRSRRAPGDAAGAPGAGQAGLALVTPMSNRGVRVPKRRGKGPKMVRHG